MSCIFCNIVKFDSASICSEVHTYHGPGYFTTYMFPGYKAFGKEEGSWFIQKLCQVLTKQHEERDLESMLIEVNHRVATEHITKMPTKDGGRLDKKRSVPWVASMLTKQVWFYPPEKNQNLRLTDHRNWSSSYFRVALTFVCIWNFNEFVNNNLQLGSAGRYCFRTQLDG